MYHVFASIFLAAMTLSTAETGPDRLTDLEDQLKSHPNDLKLLEQYGREARQGFDQALDPANSTHTEPNVRPEDQAKLRPGTIERLQILSHLQSNAQKAAKQKRLEQVAR
jgi:hypothetical protein